MTVTEQHHALQRAFASYWASRVERGAAFAAEVGAPVDSPEALADRIETARAELGSGRWGAVDVPASTLDVLAERAHEVPALEEAIAALPPGSPWAILAAARAIARGAPLALFDATCAQHAVMREPEDADRIAEHALHVDHSIARFGGDAEKRVNALADALHRGGAPIPLLQQIARAADTEARPVLALDAVDAGLRLADRAEDPSWRRALLGTRALVQLSLYDLDGCAASCAAMERLQPGSAALVDAYRRALGQPFDMWIRVPAGEYPPPAIELAEIQERIDHVVGNLAPVRRTLARRLGERCPLPPLDALSDVGLDDHDEDTERSVPDLLLEARVGWGVLCFLFGACGEATPRRPEALGAPRFPIAGLRAMLGHRLALLEVLEEAGTLGELDDAARTALREHRWGGPEGVSILDLPPQLAGIWRQEVEAQCRTLDFLAGEDADDADESDADESDADGSDASASGELSEDSRPIDRVTVDDLPPLTPAAEPIATASFGAGRRLAPLGTLGWPLQVARIGDEVVLAGNLGSAGNVVRSSDGVHFRPLLPHGTKGLRQVYGANPATLLAVGEYGTVLKLRQMSGGIEVTTLPPPSRGCLFGVWIDRDELLVSGDDGVFAWRGQRWVQVLEADGLCRLYPTRGGVIAIGDDDGDGPQVHLRGEGDTWSRLALPGASFDAYGLCCVGNDVILVCGSGGELWRASASGAFEPTSVGDPEHRSDLYALLALGDRVHAFGSGVVGVSTDGGRTFAMEKVGGDWWGAAILPDGRQVRAGNRSLAIDDGPFSQAAPVEKDLIPLRF